MKIPNRIRYTIVLLLLTIVIPSQSQDIVTFSKYKVGDTVPDFEFKNLTNYGVSNKKLSAFNEKLVIIDFWATWCGPCVAMLPKMDSLMIGNKDQLIFISATKEPQEKAEKFLKKFEKTINHNLSIPVIYDDKELYKEFPHYSLPHYVWIVPSTRRVIAITNQLEINEKNIKDFLLKGNSNIKTTKIDGWLDYKIDEPLLPYLAQNSMAFTSNKTQYSYFTGYIDKLKSGMYNTISDASTNDSRIVFKNITRLSFFTWAFGEGKRFWQTESVKVEVKDKEKLDTDLSFEAYWEWMKTNTFCYELSVPTKDRKVIFDILKQDVVNYFQEYNVRIEKRKQVCLVLTSIGNNDSLRSKGGKWTIERSQFGYRLKNGNMPGLIIDWSYYHMTTAKMLVDETDIKFNIDMDIEIENWKDINSLNKQLAKYNLKLVEKEILAEVLVIKDAA